MDNPCLIVIGGPTASGKSNMAIELASKLDAEIFNADSRQVYREMHIGTAKPSEVQLGSVKHHFVGTRSINEPYTAGSFGMEVNEALNQYFKSKTVGLLVGGSGLYIDAVTEGFDELPEVDKEILEALYAELKAGGLAPLQAELLQRDAEFASKTDLQNPRRLLRALSVIRASGEKLSVLMGRQLPDRVYNVFSIYVKPERAMLYDRINQRVEEMIAAGLLDEARALYPHRTLKPLQTVGYQELFTHFDGDWDLETATEKIKQHTRNYAKRQYTWFNRKAHNLVVDSLNIDPIIKQLNSP